MLLTSCPEILTATAKKWKFCKYSLNMAAPYKWPNTCVFMSPRLSQWNFTVLGQNRAFVSGILEKSKTTLAPHFLCAYCLFVSKRQCQWFWNRFLKNSVYYVQGFNQGRRKAGRTKEGRVFSQRKVLSHQFRYPWLVPDKFPLILIYLYKDRTWLTELNALNI